MSTEYLDQNIPNNSNDRILSSDFTRSIGNIGLDSIMIAFAMVISLLVYSLLKHFVNKIFIGENENLIAKFVTTVLLIAVFIGLRTYAKC